MSNPQSNDPEPAEPEFSPEARAVLGKARRSFGISIGILLLGFMAIGFALVYRVMRDRPPEATVASVVIPPGAEVVSAINTDGTVQVTYRAGGVVMLAVFNQGTGKLVRSVQIGAE